jgi:hypothetical protein
MQGSLLDHAPTLTRAMAAGINFVSQQFCLMEFVSDALLPESEHRVAGNGRWTEAGDRGSSAAAPMDGVLGWRL